MKKSEIKDNIKSIVEVIKIARENMDKYLQQYKNIKEHLYAIQLIEEENGIDSGINYKTIEIETLVSFLSVNEDIQEIEEQFDRLLSDLENWQDESSENKAEQIQENYIDTLIEIKESFDIDSIECEEDLDNQLFDMINTLEDMEI